MNCGARGRAVRPGETHASKNKKILLHQDCRPARPPKVTVIHRVGGGAAAASSRPKGVDSSAALNPPDLSLCVCVHRQDMLAVVVAGAGTVGGLGDTHTHRHRQELIIELGEEDGRKEVNRPRERLKGGWNE